MASAEVESTTAMVVAGDEETRVLLRGLLRLHHFRVVGEAEGASRAVDLLKQEAPSVLVTDVNLADGEVGTLLDEARRAAPKLRVILVTPASHPTGEHAASKAPDVVLIRPFRIRQFAEALRPSEAPQPPERSN